MPKKIDERRVFEAVREIWIDRGYAGTTTKQVALLAGVNEATLFRRYGDKANLVISAICEPLNKVPLRELTPTDDVQADLTHIVQSYVQTNQQVGTIFPLLLWEVSRYPELRPAFAVALENMGFLIRVIEHHQAAGALQREPVLATLTGLIGPLVVIELFRRAHPTPPVVDVDSHVRAFLHGRATRSPS